MLHAHCALEKKQNFLKNINVIAMPTWNFIHMPTCPLQAFLTQENNNSETLSTTRRVHILMASLKTKYNYF